MTQHKSASELINEGKQHHRLSQWEAACQSYENALAIAPDNNEALSLLASLHFQQDNIKQADKTNSRLLSINPKDAGAHNLAGLIKIGQKRHAEAIESFQHAIKIKPDFIAAYEKLAQIQYQDKDYNACISTFLKLLKYATNKANVLNNIAIVYQHSQQGSEARQYYQQALDISPNNASIYLNLGSLDLYENKLKAAIKHLKLSIRLNRKNPIAYNHLGNALQRNFKPDEAIVAYKMAIQLQANYADAHLNLGFAYLRAGDYQHGWQEHEWRLKTSPNTALIDYKKELASGSKKILVTSEQGLGDCFQFFRFLPLLRERGHSVTFEAPKSIYSLLKQSNTIDEIFPTGNQARKPHTFDLRIPIMSLPFALDITLDNLPSATSYIRASKKKTKQWENIFDKSKLNVGIAWAGNTNHPNDHHRSTSLKQFESLADIQNVQLYSLQYGKSQQQIKLSTINDKIVDCGQPWVDAAAIIHHLDIVICVDTSIAHLSAAMGKRTWILLPYYSDWRWLTDQQDSPWYPSIKLFRQNKYSDWDTVFNKVHQKLKNESLNMR